MDDMVDRVTADYAQKFDAFLLDHLWPYGITKNNVEDKAKRVKINIWEGPHITGKVYDIFVDCRYRFSIRALVDFDLRSNPGKPEMNVRFEKFCSKTLEEKD